MPNLTRNKGNSNKIGSNRRRSCITESRIEKSNNTKCWQGSRTKEVLIHLLTGVELFTVTSKSSFAKPVSNWKWDDQRPSSCKSRTRPGRNLCPHVEDVQIPKCLLLETGMLAIATNAKPPKCLSAGRWRSELVYSIKCSSADKMDRWEVHVSKWVN